MALTIKEMREMRNAWEGNLRICCSERDLQMDPVARNLYREIMPLLRKMDRIIDELVDMESDTVMNPREIQESLLLEESPKNMDPETKKLYKEAQAYIKRLEKLQKAWYQILRHNKSLI